MMSFSSVEACFSFLFRIFFSGTVLSGGCFANRLLLDGMMKGLRKAGLAAFAHERVPTGDGGIALGQAVAAAEKLRRMG